MKHAACAPRARRIAAVTAAALACACAAPGPTLPPDAAARAAEAFVWGYPLVVTRRTGQVLARIAGTNQFLHQDTLADPGLRVVVAPNQDTVYSLAVVDLRGGPIVLTVAAPPVRYWTYQFLDAWGDAFHYVGTRTTGGGAVRVVLTAPGHGPVTLDGATVLEAPTPWVLLLGRYLASSAAELAALGALERTLTPWHLLAGAPAPEAPDVSLGGPAGAPQDALMLGAPFFDELGDALELGPPAREADARALARFRALGIGPGEHPATTGGAALRRILEEGAAEGRERVLEAARAFATPANGWMLRRDLGTYDDPDLRAATARILWGAHVPEECLYAVATQDREGVELSGAHRYRLRFGPGELPPVDAAAGFWSLTVYGPDMFFAERDDGRYAVGDRTEGLHFETDGALELTLGTGGEGAPPANWLPTPAGPFVLVVRMALPAATALAGSYTLPPIERHAN